MTAFRKLPTRMYCTNINSWIKPQGYDTGIKIYNCIAKTKVPLISKQKGIITWYTCGPTVYDEAHIGHASCYLKVDIIQRILRKYFNFNLISVMNVTDVDDKILKKSKELNMPFIDVSQLYEKKFWEDLGKMKINKPDLILRVSENIACIKDFISCLMDKQMAYVGKDGSVYFNIKQLPKYGKLVNVSNEVNNDQIKPIIPDCALWKSSKLNEPSWESPWGSGRPGWHVECSAMASKIFGSSIDIHAGGMDLKFPHHENEEAQSCVYHSSSQWVSYWLHVGQLHCNSSEKMSKSLKNTVSVKSLLENHEPDTFRFACLMSHYKSRMEYSPELLRMAANTLKKYRNFISNCDMYCLKNMDVSSEGHLNYLLLESREELHQALCDDFDTPEVINIMNRIVKTINNKLMTNSVSVFNVIGLRNFICEVLNLLNIPQSANENIVQISSDSDVLNILKHFRQKVREIGLSTKDGEILKLCDEVRSSLRNSGIEIKDLTSGKVYSKI